MESSEKTVTASDFLLAIRLILSLKIDKREKLKLLFGIRLKDMMKASKPKEQ